MRITKVQTFLPDGGDGPPVYLLISMPEAVLTPTTTDYKEPRLTDTPPRTMTVQNLMTITTLAYYKSGIRGVLKLREVLDNNRPPDATFNINNFTGFRVPVGGQFILILSEELYNIFRDVISEQLTVYRNIKLNNPKANASQLYCKRASKLYGGMFDATATEIALTIATNYERYIRNTEGLNYVQIRQAPWPVDYHGIDRYLIPRYWGNLLQYLNKPKPPLDNLWEFYKLDPKNIKFITAPRKVDYDMPPLPTTVPRPGR